MTSDFDMRLARAELRLLAAVALYEPSQQRSSDGKWQDEGKGSGRQIPKAAPATKSIRITPDGSAEEVASPKAKHASKKAAAAKAAASPEQQAAMESLKKKIEVHRAKQAATSHPSDHPKTVDEALTHFPTSTRVRISDIHKKLPHMSKEQINAELMKGQEEGKHQISRIDYAPDIRPEDERTAINVAGFPRHIIYRHAGQPTKPGAEKYRPWSVFDHA